MAFTFTDENVEEIIASGSPVVIDCWATWCAPCVAMGPIIDGLSEEYQGRAIIGKYNVEDETTLSDQYRIMALPTVLFFKDGHKVDIRLTGSQSRQSLVENIEKLLAL